MSEGWICPKCGRALAPWMPECPCNNVKTVTQTDITFTWQGGKCPYVCDNKTDLGYCRFTACVNPAHMRKGGLYGG